MAEVTNLVHLIKGYHNDTLSEKEQDELVHWINADEKNEKLFSELTNSKKQVETFALMAKYKNKEIGLKKIYELPQEPLSQHVPSIKKLTKNNFFRYAAAVFILTLVGLGIYVNKPNEESALVNHLSDPGPGSNKAVLTLSDGRTIDLSGNQEGIVMNTDSIIYNDGSILTANSSKALDSRGSESFVPAMLTMSTPKGGQYQVTLSDGTKVWLNTSSSLRYPSQFTDDKRIVELNGEAYFEVSSNKDIPFIVKSSTQEVEVLGTSFNIMAYHDELAVETTLLEGSVRLYTNQNKVPSSILLKPNEQSLLNIDNSFQVVTVNPAIALAWKNGDFIFQNESLESIMRKLARWYNVDFIYPTGMENFYFSGMVSRSRNLSAVLEMLESTEQLKFKIKGRKVRLMM